MLERFVRCAGWCEGCRRNRPSSLAATSLPQPMSKKSWMPTILFAAKEFLGCGAIWAKTMVRQLSIRQLFPGYGRARWVCACRSGGDRRQQPLFLRLGARWVAASAPLLLFLAAKEISIIFTKRATNYTKL